MSEKSVPIYRRLIKTFSACLGIILLLYGAWVAGAAGYSRLLSAHAADPVRHTVPDMNQPDAAEAATLLTPSDPEARQVHGAILQAYGRLNEAVKEYEQAAMLRPRDHDLWLELGLTRDESDDQEGAIIALKESVRLSPFYAEPHWYLGNIELRAGQTDEAFQEMRQAAAGDPSFLPQLTDLAWAVYEGDVRRVEQAVSPQTPAARLALARYSIKHGKVSEGVALFRSAGAVSEAESNALLQELLTAGRFREAYEVWSGTEAGKRAGEHGGITDGGFEELKSLSDQPGFGWRHATDQKDVQVTLDATEPHGGKQSLRLSYKGNANPNSPLVSELLLVEPGARYRLKFSVRTQDLVTGGPPFVVVADANGDKKLAESPPLPRNTNGWQDYTVEFEAGKGTEAVRVSVQRQACAAEPCQIFGNLWVDDFLLQKF